MSGIVAASGSAPRAPVAADDLRTLLRPGMSTIYLASRSARRHELLRQIGVAFTELPLRNADGRPPDVVEVPFADESGLDYVSRIANAKVRAGWLRMKERRLPILPVLAADTEVVLTGRIFGKPMDAEDARAMLGSLSGVTHEVITAVAVCAENESLLTLSRSLVTLRELTLDEIDRYVASGEPFGKAGGYAIQALAAAFVTRLEGSHSGVMGLPLYETTTALAKIGVRVL